MFNFLVAAAPDLDVVQAYFESIPDFVVAFYTFVGFFLGVMASVVINCLDDLSRFIKRFVLKKRVNKSAKELTDYVDMIINREESEGE